MNPVSVKIASEDDLVSARFEGREIARNVGFRAFEQTLVGMVISELARNMLLVCKGGTIEIEAVDGDSRKGVRVLAITQESGTKEGQNAVPTISATAGGLGAGLAGVQRLVDELSVSRNGDNSCTVEVLK